MIAVFSLRAPAALTDAAPAAAFPAQWALIHVWTIASVPHPIGSTEFTFSEPSKVSFWLIARRLRYPI
jgi:hypothetical protein